MKKIITLMLVAVLAVFALSGCGTSKSGEDKNDKKIKIVTTIFPEYDWVMQILGDKADKADVTMLLDKGVDLHSYQPSTADIAKISEADVFIYVGGESDEWVEDVLKEAKNKNLKVINLMDVMGDKAKEEEVKEGMQPEEEEAEEAKDGKEEEEVEYDEHVWLSLKNAKIFTKKIADVLSEVDKDDAKTYQANYESYAKKLDDLDKKYADAVASAKNKTLVFGDRFPFRYLVNDYGLDYYAAFVGCSAESEASFETVTFLAKKIDELGLGNVLTIEGKNHKIAKTVVDNTKNKDQKVLTMDSMQSTTAKDVKDGATYLGIMEKNLEVLKEALK
ncbi:ABC transporter substrate-binding protein [Eubacterium sulci ATCC 35585]|nr:ABC transporter substrate-binding protein [Eubacterium sulci ATCC 35585]EUC78691.1 periplasmic solute-binding family protein [Eubacterium sulci ATCC 35585]